jgi:hypothetical protein
LASFLFFCFLFFSFLFFSSLINICIGDWGLFLISFFSEIFFYFSQLRRIFQPSLGWINDPHFLHQLVCKALY